MCGLDGDVEMCTGVSTSVTSNFFFGVNKIKVLSKTDRKVKQDLDNIILSLKAD